MYLDFLLAAVHHLLIFLMAAGLAAEIALLRVELTPRTIALLSRADAVYGGSAGAIILVGIGRVFFSLKGWEYYVSNHAFWGKMALFVVVGILSARPTMRIGAWRKSFAAEPSFVIPQQELAGIRRYVTAEACFFLLIPVFAAAMARDIGS